MLVRAKELMMKKFFVVIIMLSLCFVFFNTASATPLSGLHIEFSKWGLFQRLLGNYFDYQVQDSYKISSIWCRSLAFSSAEPGMNEGWVCTDNNEDQFIIPYESITIKNLNNQDIEIGKHRIEYGHAMTYSEKVSPEESSKLIFGQEYHAFSIKPSN
jgi:hypothetical protein